jgi:RAD54-like protein 2
VKQCFVYRFVMDNCLEKKIYDRQINKQGMADRVVDELNPDAHLSIKEVSNLLYDSEPENEAKDLSDRAANFRDDIVQTLLKKHSMQLSKVFVGKVKAP